MTVNQALARAGLDLGANQSMRIELVRRDAGGDSESVVVASLWQLRAGMDVSLQANDILIVQPPKAADRPVAAVDHLRITIHGLPGSNVPITFVKYADSQSRVHLPMVPAVGLKGLSCDEAAKAINKAYLDQNAIRNADATVTRDDIIGAWFPLGPIQPAEVLRVRTFDTSAGGLETSLDLTVSAGGDVELPHIKPARVAGLKDYEAEAAIAEAYTTALIHPMPVIAVERPGRAVVPSQPAKPAPAPAKTQTFSIMGKVPRSGQYAMNWQEHAQPETIKTALEVSGYNTARDPAQMIILIHRADQLLTFRTVGDLLDDPDSDVALQDHDIVLLPDWQRKGEPQPGGRYYVTGVAHSGAYTAAGPLSMRQALNSAGYRVEDGDYLTRISPTRGWFVLRIADVLKYDCPEWFEVLPGDLLCVCREGRAMLPPPTPTTKPSANP